MLPHLKEKGNLKEPVAQFAESPEGPGPECLAKLGYRSSLVETPLPVLLGTGSATGTETLF